MTIQKNRAKAKPLRWLLVVFALLAPLFGTVAGSVAKASIETAGVAAALAALAVGVDAGEASVLHKRAVDVADRVSAVIESVSGIGDADAFSGSGTVKAWPCPNARTGASTSHAEKRCVPYNTKLTLRCYVRGQYITGPWSNRTNLWHKTGAGDNVSDAWLVTGYDTPIPGEPKCGSTSTSTSRSCGKVLSNPHRNGTPRLTQDQGGSFSHQDVYNRYDWDFDGGHRAAIRANCPGQVHWSGWHRVGGGHVVSIKDDSTGLCWNYTHLDSRAVSTGQRVNYGTFIGRQGATGNATGSHLHVGLHKCASPGYVGASVWSRKNF